ncbi:MAG TPA: efflux RND transporter periplasmic adaptor subunit [Burkholderiales bacterium]|nr:efflux RND transporter periplasmic adaptor subunit [Burkholderiales bacterium]
MKRATKLGALGVAALIALSASLFGWQAWSASRAGTDRFATAVAKRTDLEDVVTATGTLQPRDYVDVGTQVSGQLQKLHIRVGSVVKKGDLLAEIDPTVYRSRVDADQAQLRNLNAQRAEAQAKLALSRQQLTRQQNLMKADATTTDAVQSAQAAERVAQAQLDALTAQIQQTGSTLRGDQASLGYTRIYAPMAGTVVSQTAKEGQTLNANQQAPIILRIADLSTMTVDAQVSEADVSRLQLGMEVYFKTLGGGEQRWTGKLRQVNPTPTLVNNVVLYDALFDVPNDAGRLMTQMTAQVFFVVAHAEDALTVPLAAVNNGSVRVLNENNQIEDRRVQLGLTTRVAAQVLAGLQPGERVVAGLRASMSNASGRTPRFGPRL